MSSLAASQLLAMGDKTLMGDELPDFSNKENFEDPSECWIQFVLACRTQDPSKVRPFMEKARSSKWTNELWKLATYDIEVEDLTKSEEDSDEDAPWCDGCEGPCVCGAEEL